MKEPDELNWGPRPLREWAAGIRRAVMTWRPTAGIGISISEDEMLGRQISAKRGGPSSSGGLSLSWVIFTRLQGIQLQATVGYGRMYDGYTGAVIAITGLEAEGADPLMEWQNISLGDFCYIEGEFNDGNFSTAKITFKPELEPGIRVSGGNQTEFWKMLGQIRNVDGSAVVVQAAVQDLRLLSLCFSGVPSRFPL